MPIYKGSRYENLKFTALLRQNQRSPARFLHDRENLKQSDLNDQFKIYIVKQTDELDYLAKIFGGPERLWWIIADINQIEKPYDLKPGTQLIIPTGTDFSMR